MKLNENIPEKVTKKALLDAADEYEKADFVWMESCKRRDQGLKEDAGDHLYRLVRGVLAHGFYTNGDADDEQYMTGEPVLDDNTPHNGMLEWMKSVYAKVKENDFEWKPLYPNNMPCNGVAGLYMYMFFKEDDHFKYVKFTIEYMSRCDEDGISHPEEGTKYYVLHLLKEDDLKETFEIPEPSDDYCPFDYTNAGVVNDYGRFRYVFDDEETAKKAAAKELLQMIYPATYFLSYKEQQYWDWFVKSFEKE